MFIPDHETLSAKPQWYRYVFYLLSSLRPVSPSAWRREGEPNPFVPRDLRPRMTHQQEIRDIFEDSLGRR